MKGALSHTMALVFLAANIVGTLPVAVSPGDSLDLDGLMARAIDPGDGGGIADINGDGRVDILDLQGLASAAADLPEDEGSASPLDGIGVAGPRLGGPMLADGVDYVTGPLEQAAGPVLEATALADTSPPRSNRYRFVLTPHAPPSLA